MTLPSKVMLRAADSSPCKHNLSGKGKTNTELKSVIGLG